MNPIRKSNFKQFVSWMGQFCVTTLYKFSTVTSNWHTSELKFLQLPNQCVGNTFPPYRDSIDKPVKERRSEV